MEIFDFLVGNNAFMLHESPGNNSVQEVTISFVSSERVEVSAVEEGCFLPGYFHREFIDKDGIFFLRECDGGNGHKLFLSRHDLDAYVDRSTLFTVIKNRFICGNANTFSTKQLQAAKDALDISGETPIPLAMRRIKASLDKLFTGKFSVNGLDDFYKRAVSAAAIAALSGTDITTAANSVTAGPDDCEIHAVFKDEKKKKLYFVHSDWQENGRYGFPNTLSTLCLNLTWCVTDNDFFWGFCNDTLQPLKKDVLSAIQDIDYQIQIVLVHTGQDSVESEDEPYKSHLEPIHRLLSKLNEGGTVKVIDLVEFKRMDIYRFLKNTENGV